MNNSPINIFLFRTKRSKAHFMKVAQYVEQSDNVYGGHPLVRPD